MTATCQCFLTDSVRLANGIGDINENSVDRIMVLKEQINVILGESGPLQYCGVLRMFLKDANI